MTDHLYRDRPFKPGDRVQLTDHALSLCDPACHESETRGQVVELRPNGHPLVQFEDGEPPQIMPSSFLEKLA